MKRLLIAFVLLVFGVAGQRAQSQTESSPDGLTARDAFWSASDLVSVAPNPAARSAAATAAPARKPAKTHTAKHKSAPKEIDSAIPTLAESRHRAGAPASSQIDPQLVTASGYGSQPHLVRVSATATAQPFGLRYTLLEQQSGGSYAEVFPETVFHSGDKVKLSVMANQPGYLYIIEQGSSGSWVPLFPAQNAAPESNRVEAGRVYMVPSASDESFQFNQQPGKEHLFILLSREPVADLDQVIFGLQHKTSTPAPASTAPTAAQSAAVMVADNRITDALVEQLQSRDLTLVKDTSQQETTDAQYGEKAIYVVNHGKDAASRVFASMVLDHE